MHTPYAMWQPAPSRALSPPCTHAHSRNHSLLSVSPRVCVLRVLCACSHLAGVYYAQGKYLEAEKMYRTLHEAQERLYPSDTDVDELLEKLATASNLANALDDISYFLTTFPFI